MSDDNVTIEGELRRDYPHIAPIQTRWSDNDIYGHVNNVTYYSYFDTVVNTYLIERGGLDIFDGDIIGVAVETMCRFAASVAFPEKIVAGLRVGHLGRSSVRYEIAIFREDEEQASAWGHFVHVFVNRSENASVPIPDDIRVALEKLERGNDA